jgi:hypothetical protein
LLHDIHDLFLFRTIRSMGRGPRFEDVTGASSVRDSLSGRLWTIPFNSSGERDDGADCNCRV